MFDDISIRKKLIYFFIFVHTCITQKEETIPSKANVIISDNHRRRRDIPPSRQITESLSQENRKEEGEGNCDAENIAPKKSETSSEAEEPENGA